MFVLIPDRTPGRALALAPGMTIKDKIDDAATKAKELAEKAGHATADAATKTADVAHKAAEKIKDAGASVGKKLGA